FSIIAPIANVLVAPFIPLAMLFGFVGTIVSSVAFLPGQIIAYVGWACLQWILAVSSILAAIPYASVHTPAINGWIMLIYYAALIGLLWRASRMRTHDAYDDQP